MSNYQLKIVDFYCIPIVKVKKLVPIFDEEKYVLHYKILQLKTRINTKKINCVLKFSESQWLKPSFELNTQKRMQAEKNGDKDG